MAINWDMLACNKTLFRYNPWSLHQMQILIISHWCVWGYSGIGLVVETTCEHNSKTNAENLQYEDYPFFRWPCRLFMPHWEVRKYQILFKILIGFLFFPTLITGKKPENTITDSLKNRKKPNHMDKIDNPEVRELIAACLDHDSKKRPPAHTLVDRLQKIHNPDKK